jgi:hypothetical protein
MKDLKSEVFNKYGIKTYITITECINKVIDKWEKLIKEGKDWESAYVQIDQESSIGLPFICKDIVPYFVDKHGKHPKDIR